MSELESPDSFDAEYVKSLREEAGKYRTKAKSLESELEGYKGLEAQIREARVENELVRRGVTAEAGWISMTADQTPAQAVDTFLEKYPMFGTSVEAEVEVEPKQMPKAIAPKPTNPNENAWEKRGFDEIKADPVARQNLTDVYRDLLKSSSNLKD